MPHIIVFHNLNTDVKPLLHGLHEALSAHESVKMRQTKTYSVPLQHAIVGTDEQPADMIHIQVRMKPGRPDEVRQHLSDILHDTARDFVNKSGLISSVSVEIHELDAPTYRSSYL